MNDQNKHDVRGLNISLDRRGFLIAGTGLASSFLMSGLVVGAPLKPAEERERVSKNNGSPEETDISRSFAEFAAVLKYEDLPPAVVDAAKKSLLDTLGVILAASGIEPAIRPLIDLLKESAGKEESTVFGEGIRLPASAAAFANGALAHCLDFDPQTPWGAHCDSSIVPTVLALAEQRGGCSGKDLIRAIAIGQEIFIRLRLNVGWHMDWNLSTVIGCFSATCAGAALLGLDAAQIAHAMGIVSMQSSGTMELVFGVGSDLRGMYAGFCSQACVTAVRLAERGMTGIENLFEGEAGLFSVYFKREYNRKEMLAGLGRNFSSGGMLYKYWPAVGNAHTYIHASIMLSCEHNIDTEQIRTVNVYVGDFQQRMCMPLEVRQAPGTSVDAKFSLPFLVSLALARRQVKVSDFSHEALNAPEILSLARKVVPVSSPAYDWKAKLPDGRVEILMSDGTVYSREGSGVPGSSELPMTWEQISHKFSECARLATNPAPLGTISEAISFVKKLEDAPDATVLVKLIT